MSTVDDYIATLASPERKLFEQMSTIIKTTVPNVEQGTSYSMPAFLYKGKPVASFIVRKSYLSLYPFSGKVIAILNEELKGFETTSGSIHFTVDRPLTGSLLKDILAARIQEIDSSKPSPRK